MAVDKEKVLDSAQKYADKNQFEKAIKEIQKISDSCGNDCRVLLRLATYYEKAQHYPESIDTLKHVATIYRTQGAYQKALAVLKQAQKLDPGNIELTLEAAELYGSLSLPHEAISQLSACLSQCEGQPESELYGRVLQMMVRLDSENVQTRMKYAQYLINVQHDQEGAVRQYSLALAQLYSKEKFVDYVQTAREYLKLASEDADVIKRLAEIYMKMNRFNDAVVIMSDLHADKRTQEIHELLVKCFQQLRRPRDAVYELKLLARQLEASNARQDVIEDVWMRAHKIDPRDPEVLKALEGDLPEISSTALNVVSDSILQPVGVLEQAAQPTPSQPPSVPRPAAPSQQNRAVQLSNEFSRALECYRSGDFQNAALICQRIIQEDEHHLPSLRLLGELYEGVQDWYSLAQVERKIAKAVYQVDLEDAIRHVLRAEQCTPRAWENYNLLCVFGVDPSRYGLVAPDGSTGMVQGQAGYASQPPAQAAQSYPQQRVSQAVQSYPQSSAPAPQIPVSAAPVAPVRRIPSVNIPAAQVPTAPPVPRSAPPVPPSANMSRPSAPPIPPRPSVPPVPSAPPIPKTNPVNVSAPPAVPPVRSASTGLPPHPVQANASVGSAIRPNVAGRSTSASRIPPATYTGRSMGSVPAVPQSPASATGVTSKAVIPQLGTQSVPTIGDASRPVITRRRPTAEIPAPVANIPSEVISDLRKLEQSAETVESTQSQSVTTAASYMANATMGNATAPSDPNEESSGFFDENSNEKTIAMALDDVFAGLFNEPSVDTNVKSLTEIPPAAMERVQGVLQEVDFYASINLRADASRLLNSLISEFGDVGIIHDKKVQYGL
ncbi:MAG: hypothetical protein IIY06_04270 [Proteobacteria bacterium]|nr:hypothetical protein [Pseudomonadota bacterium]